ncbi:MAG: cytochrome c3 family protein, partial [Thermoguttaceae bacterium]
MSRYVLFTMILIAAVRVAPAPGSEESRFTKTNSRDEYVHWIDLYDAADKRIDPTAESGPPYSPQYTCGRCHDYHTIVTGHHFNGIDKRVSAGRAGEPWIWTDERTGTQIPLSYRGWMGTYDPGQLGISTRQFVLKFGHHLPGGGPGEAAPAVAEPAAKAAEGGAPAEADESPEAAEARRWKLSGLLNVDCMICHGSGHNFSHETWWTQIEDENFGWASTAAIALGDMEGTVSDLKDDFDPAAADSKQKLPTVSYGLARINAEKKVYFDVVRKPDDNACYYCHSTNPVGEHAPPEWTQDEDVHLRAGFSCADCHPNDIGHHTVRGYEGEVHPSGQDVSTLSCEGCHLNQGHGGGRMGAPKPLHKGLPPLHFKQLSCTACHSGPKLEGQAELLQTSLAHSLGLPAHVSGKLPPGIVAPVMMRDQGMLYPYRAVWPAFWGQIVGDKISPLNPDAVYEATRKTLRVRRGSSLAAAIRDVKLSSDDKKAALGEDRSKVKDEELTAEEKAKLDELIATRGAENWKQMLAAGLKDVKQILTDQGAEPVFVSAGKAYRLSGEDSVETFEHPAAEPYAWKFAHDVRPARLSLGVK